MRECSNPSVSGGFIAELLTEACSATFQGCIQIFPRESSIWNNEKGWCMLTSKQDKDGMPLAYVPRLTFYGKCSHVL